MDSVPASLTAPLTTAEIARVQRRTVGVLSVAQVLGGIAFGATLSLGAVLAAQGQLGRGLRLMEDVSETWLRRGSRFRYANSLFIMGRFYARIAQATVWKKLAILFKEPGFAAKLRRSVKLLESTTMPSLRNSASYSATVSPSGVSRSSR